jgi:hypothetical protein
VAVVGFETRSGEVLRRDIVLMGNLNLNAIQARQLAADLMAAADELEGMTASRFEGLVPPISRTSQSSRSAA